MTRSLLPTLDGLPFGLSRFFFIENFVLFSLIILFIPDPNLANTNTEGNPMSRSSFASFHLTGIKPTSGKIMTSSVDRLFENDGDVFLSSNFADFQVNNFFKFTFN